MWSNVKILQAQAKTLDLTPEDVVTIKVHEDTLHWVENN